MQTMEKKIQGSGFLETGNIYIKYAHLKEIKVAENVEIDAGVVVGIAGTSGVPEGTCDLMFILKLRLQNLVPDLPTELTPAFMCTTKMKMK